MSIDAIDRVLAHSRATGTDRVVLLVLARHDFGNGVFPGRQRIARLANVSVKRVGEAFHRLSLLGELSRDLRPGKSSLYTIKVDCTEGCCVVGTPGVPTTDDRSAPQGSRGSAPQGSRVRVPEGNPSSLKEKRGGAGALTRSSPPSQHPPAVTALLAWLDTEDGERCESRSGYAPGTFRRWLTEGKPKSRDKGLRDVSNERRNWNRRQQESNDGLWEDVAESVF